jgi:hypothetical protein
MEMKAKRAQRMRALPVKRATSALARTITRRVRSEDLEMFLTEETLILVATIYA